MKTKFILSVALVTLLAGCTKEAIIPEEQLPATGEPEYLPRADARTGSIIQLGDFNGDGTTDVLYSRPSTVQPFRYQWVCHYGGKPIPPIPQLPYPWLINDYNFVFSSDLLIGDFNGDGRSDALYGNGTRWRIFWNGEGDGELTVGTATKKVHLLVGDFNGDGRSDIFYPTGSQWNVSYSGRSLWNVLAYSSTNVTQLKIGDFDGDGKSDVLYGSGSIWQISYGGTSTWVQTINSTVKAANMLIGDFNGDGADDVLYGSGGTGGKWMVSYNATEPFVNLITAGAVVPDLFVGKFNADNISDVFYPTGADWRVSYNARNAYTILTSTSVF